MKNKNHLKHAANYPCVICGNPNVELHHITAGAGMGRKNPDSHVISLCSSHHRLGGYGVAIHAGQKAWEANYGKQEEILYTFLLQMESDGKITDYAAPVLESLRLKYG